LRYSSNCWLRTADAIINKPFLLLSGFVVIYS
jgi:hypothetical protein